MRPINSVFDITYEIWSIYKKLALCASSQCIVITNIESPNINNWYFMYAYSCPYPFGVMVYFWHKKMVIHRRLITQSHHCTILRKKDTVNQCFPTINFQYVDFNPQNTQPQYHNLKVLHIPNLLRLEKTAVAILRYHSIAGLFLLI